MKKVLALLISVIGFSFAANAQIVYQPTYNRGSGYGNSQQVQQVVRATAYYISGYDTYKLPIKVSVVSDGYGGSRYVVTAYYVRGTGIYYTTTGQDPDWASCNEQVSKTNRSSYSSGLENSFMYKAYVNGRYVYFDL